MAGNSLIMLTHQATSPSALETMSHVSERVA